MVYECINIVLFQSMKPAGLHLKNIDVDHVCVTYILTKFNYNLCELWIMASRVLYIEAYTAYIVLFCF